MKKLLALIALSIFFSNIASASFISLTTTISDINIENSSQTNIKIVNSGDEPAFSLSISMLLPEGFESDKILIGKLNSNSSFEGIFNITRNREFVPGKYPVVVLTEYTDANGHPFSAVSSSHLVYKTPTLSKISGTMSTLTLKGKESKKLVLNLKNLDDLEHTVRVKLFLPLELKSVDVERTLVLEGKDEKNLEFEVSNFNALEGSSYAVLASAEYENNLHYSSLITGIIRIGKTDEGLIQSNFIYILISIYVVAIGTIIFYKLRHKNRKTVSRVEGKIFQHPCKNRPS
jgi:hypothetical protein